MNFCKDYSSIILKMYLKNEEISTKTPLESVTDNFLNCKTKPSRPLVSLKAIISLLTITQLTLATIQLIENTIIISLKPDWFQHKESR